VYPHPVDPQPNPESLSLTPDEAFDRPARRYPAARRQKRERTEPCLEVKESVLQVAIGGWQAGYRLRLAVTPFLPFQRGDHAPVTPRQRPGCSDSGMLCGYGLARCLVGPPTTAGEPGQDPARIGASEPGVRFPSRYDGAFDRQAPAEPDDGARPRVLSQSARNMLELNLGPHAASRLIDCVERMAAVASRAD
jgi:hypothetical protein